MNAGRVIWITGLPRSGKTTLARAVVDALRARSVPALWLDSDDLRAVMTPEATYSDRERDVFYATVAHLAALGAQGGIIVVVSATASKRVYRDAARSQAPRFTEVYVYCSPQSRDARDDAGLYARAKTGAITNLPGAGAPYEPPAQPELTFDTDQGVDDAMVKAVLTHIGF